MGRTTFDCARVPEADNCSLQLSGEKADVLKAAKEHLVSTHNNKDPKLEQKIQAVVDNHEQTTPYATWHA
jgi:hypothetical protein